MHSRQLKSCANGKLISFDEGHLKIRLSHEDFPDVGDIDSEASCFYGNWRQDYCSRAIFRTKKKNEDHHDLFYEPNKSLNGRKIVICGVLPPTQQRQRKANFKDGALSPFSRASVMKLQIKASSAESRCIIRTTGNPKSFINSTTTCTKRGHKYGRTSGTKHLWPMDSIKHRLLRKFFIIWCYSNITIESLMKTMILQSKGVLKSTQSMIW